MITLIKWWLTWLGRGMKLAFLLAAALAAAAAVYMGWEWLAIMHPGFNLEPKTAKYFGYAWNLFGHSVELAMFAFVAVNWFPDFFRAELAEIADRKKDT
jgi:hypothetical protein